MKLTKMEKMVLNATRTNEYNDCYEDNSTWAFAVVENSGMSAKKARGVISSLIKKNLIWFQEDEEEDMIGLTEEGKKLFETADGEECSWSSARLLKIEDEVEEKEEKKEEENMNNMTVQELRARAKEMGLKGYTKMNKAQLIATIKTANAINKDTAKLQEEIAAEEHHTVTVRAFTGMMIGEFEVVKETKTQLVVKTKKGDELKFDKKTGLQTNGNNPKFANRIEL